MSATYSKNSEHCNCSCYNDNLKLISDTQLVTIIKKQDEKRWIANEATVNFFCHFENIDYTSDCHVEKLLGRKKKD